MKWTLDLPLRGLRRDVYLPPLRLLLWVRIVPTVIFLHSSRTGKRSPPGGDGWQFRAGKRFDDAVMDDFKRSSWMLR